MRFASLAALAFPDKAWIWVALAAAVILIPLAWLSLAPAGRHSRTLAVGIALRTLGIGLLAITLLDPQWTGTRASKGENVLAILADNSEGLAIADSGQSQTRGDILRDRLGTDASPWLDAMTDDFQVRTYSFGQGLRRVGDFSRLDFSDERSDLHEALRSLRERHAQAPLAGVLLFTDGNATDARFSPDELAQLPPVYPVVIGEGAVSDVRIEGISVRQTAFDDAPVNVQVEIASSAAENKNLLVSIVPIAGSGSLAPSVAPPPAVVRLAPRDAPKAVGFSWKPGGSGIRFFEARITAEDGTEIVDAAPQNNRRLFMLDLGRPEFRILYASGRPGWEFKFLNRALLEDPQLHMIGLLRVARREPKFEFKGRAGESSNPVFRGFDGSAEEAPRYDQPVLVRVNARNEDELRDGFPKFAEELFAYDAVILDDLEADAFGAGDLSLLRRFVAERGGGLLMLGGADSLESGGYADSPLAAALPVHLGDRSVGFEAETLTWRLTREGWLEPWMRVRDTEAAERIRLQDMPPLRVAHKLTDIKPGATVLAAFEDRTGHETPALVAQRYGLGRSAVLAAGDLWRWGFRSEAHQADLARFWRQIARWLVADTAARVTLDARPGRDGAGTELVVKVRNNEFRSEDLARVRLDIERIDSEPISGETADGPEFTAVSFEAPPAVDQPGRYAATFPSTGRGGYLARAEASAQDGAVIGSAESGWVVDSAAAEFQSLAPNRRLLAEIAGATGGKVVAWDQLEDLAQSLPYRSAPIMEPWTFPLWNTAWVFLVVLACFLAEWGWRRWRGLP